MPDPTGRVSHLPDFHRGVSWKQPVRVASTANGTLATAFANGQTVDGVVLATNDRILLKDQTTGSANGIYLVAASGAPTRAFDMDQDTASSVPAEEVMGSVVYVIAGTTNGGTLWRNTNTTAPTLGSTSLTFAQITLSSLAASSVTVLDSAGYYTATDVEAALAELAKKDIGYTAHGNTGATETFDALTGWHSATLDANCTFTFTGATSGLVAAMVLELTQDATGSRTVTWPGSVVWPGGAAPTLSTAAAAVDVLTFFSRDGGTTWYGFPTGSSAITVKDEGSSLATAATSINFVGAGVTATGATAAKTVTIPGGATASDTGVWRPTGDGAGGFIFDGTTFEVLVGFGPA